MREKVVMNGNNIVTVVIGERNKNRVRIHNNSIGKTVYENENVWDSDILKIVRILKKYENNHYLDFRDILIKINRECRHLKIEIDFLKLFC